MKEVYRLAKGWRIFTYAFCIGLTVLALFLIYKSLTETAPHSIYYTLGALGVLFVVYYAFQDTRYGRLIITDDDVTLISPFGKRTLPLDAIKGYSKIEQYIVIHPKERTLKKIKVSTYLERIPEIHSWLAERFPDVDEMEAMEEEEEILRNEEFGITEESRARRLGEARTVAKIINRGAWVTMFWVLLYPYPYTPSVTLAILFPLIAMGSCYYYRGLMMGGDKAKSAYPSVAEGFILPGMGLLLRALFDYNILEYSNGWFLIIMITVALFLLYQLPTGGFRPKKTADYMLLIFFPIFTFAYSFGSILIINCAADKSTPESYETTIESKHISKGKTTTYYLELRPWGDRLESEEVKVSGSDYNRMNVNDTVTVIQRHGYLKIPWIVLDL